MGESDIKPQAEQERDDFGAAFESLAAGLKEPGTPAVVEKTDPPANETPEAKAAREKAAVDAAAAAAAAETPEAKAAREKAAADAAAAAAAAETPEAKAAREKAAADSDTAKQLADAQRQLAEANAKLATHVAAPAAPAKVDEKPLYTTEEQAVLDQYTGEWAVVRKGEELVRRAEYRQLVGYIFDQISQSYGPALAYIESRSSKDQYSDIKSLVSDYDQVRDATIAWAAKQPSFLKTTYEKVIKDGSAEDVRDLIDIFKKATGYAAPAAAAPAAAPAAGMAAAPAANDPKAAAAIAALKPVDTNRTTMASGADPNDFDNAFKEFAGAAK